MTYCLFPSEKKNCEMKKNVNNTIQALGIHEPKKKKINSIYFYLKANCKLNYPVQR